MSGPKVFPPPEALAAEALVSRTEYDRMYHGSVEDPEKFWGGAHGRRIGWIRPYAKVKDSSYGPGKVSVRRFHDGTLNACSICVDRHAERTPDKVAVIWEGDDPAEDRKFTYAQLKSEVCRMANVLRSLGVRRGDRVTIYMPMIPEVAFAMLACAHVAARSGHRGRADQSPEVWMRYHEVVGEGRCPVVETRRQTETGAFLITPLPRRAGS